MLFSRPTGTPKPPTPPPGKVMNALLYKLRLNITVNLLRLQIKILRFELQAFE